MRDLVSATELFDFKFIDREICMRFNALADFLNLNKCIPMSRIEGWRHGKHIGTGEVSFEKSSFQSVTPYT